MLQDPISGEPVTLGLIGRAQSRHVDISGPWAYLHTSMVLTTTSVSSRFLLIDPVKRVPSFIELWFWTARVIVVMNGEVLTARAGMTALGLRKTKQSFWRHDFLRHDFFAS